MQRYIVERAHGGWRQVTVGSGTRPRGPRAAPRRDRGSGDFAPGEGVRAGAAGPGFDAGELDRRAGPGRPAPALLAAGRIPIRSRTATRTRSRGWRSASGGTGCASTAVDRRRDERLRLVLHGLDTFATVYLNGEELGPHGNMFRPAVFDVSDRCGRRTSWRSASTRRCAHVGAAARGPVGAERARARMDAQGPVRLWLGLGPAAADDRRLAARRAAPRARGRRSPGSASPRCAPTRARRLVEVSVEAERLADEGAARGAVDPAAAGRRGADGAPVADGVPARRGFAARASPALWWTHDLGEPALHRLEVTLLLDGEEVARARERGRRAHARARPAPDPDEPGTRFFRFRLNGVPGSSRAGRTGSRRPRSPARSPASATSGC